MSSIGTLAVNVVANTEKFSHGMAHAKHEAGMFGKVAHQLEHTIIHLGTAMAAGFAIHSLHETVEEVEKLALASKRLDISTNSLSTLAGAARLTDVSFEGLAKALTFMEKNIGNDKGIFKKLGLDPDKLAGMHADEAFLELAEAISKLPNAAERTAASMAVFGKSGAAILPMIEKGREGIEHLQHEIKELGGELDHLGAEKAEQLAESMKLIKEAFIGLKFTIVTEAAPAIKFFTDNIVSELKVFEKLIEILKATKRGFEDTFKGKGDFSNRFARFMTGDNRNLFVSGEDEHGGHGHGAGGMSAALSKVTGNQKFGGNPLGLMGGAASMMTAIAIQAQAEQIDAFLLKRSRDNWNNLGGADQLRVANELGELDIAGNAPRSKRMRSANEVRGNGALEQGTAAAFSQARRSQQASQMMDLQKKQLKANEDSAKALRNIDKNLTNDQLFGQVVNIV